MGRNDRVPIVHHGRPALDLEYETMTLTINITAFGPPSGAPEDIEELRMIAEHVLALKKIIDKRGKATMNVSIGCPADWGIPTGQI